MTFSPELAIWTTEQAKYPRYTSMDVLVEVIREWCPNEEPDTWVEFRRIDTQALYTCRKEAFLSRYRPTP